MLKPAAAVASLPPAWPLPPARYGSKTAPADKAMVAAIEQALQAPRGR